jgi:hypothetical protein
MEGLRGVRAKEGAQDKQPCQPGARTHRWLSFDGNPYPRMEPQVRFDEINYKPDGRLTVTPSFTHTVRTAPGVDFTPLMTAMAVGINDPAGFLATGPLVEAD